MRLSAEEDTYYEVNKRVKVEKKNFLSSNKRTHSMLRTHYEI